MPEPPTEPSKKHSIRIPSDVWTVATKLLATQDEPLTFTVVTSVRMSAGGLLVTALRAYIAARKKATR